MFNVGDLVEVVVEGYPITRVGSYGKILSIHDHECYIDFEWVNWDGGPQTGHSYFVGMRFLQLREGGTTAVERKIKSIYARQNRKTGYAYLL